MRSNDKKEQSKSVKLNQFLFQHFCLYDWCRFFSKT